MAHLHTEEAATSTAPHHRHPGTNQHLLLLLCQLQCQLQGLCQHFIPMSTPVHLPPSAIQISTGLSFIGMHMEHMIATMILSIPIISMQMARLTLEERLRCLMGLVTMVHPRLTGQALECGMCSLRTICESSRTTHGREVTTMAVAAMTMATTMSLATGKVLMTSDPCSSR